MCWTTEENGQQHNMDKAYKPWQHKPSSSPIVYISLMLDTNWYKTYMADNPGVTVTILKQDPLGFGTWVANEANHEQENDLGADADIHQREGTIQTDNDWNAF